MAAAAAAEAKAAEAEAEIGGVEVAEASEAAAETLPRLYLCLVFSARGWTP